MSKVRDAVVLAEQILGLKQKLKLLEKGMSLKEFIAYVSETRTISGKYQSVGISGNDKPELLD